MPCGPDTRFQPTVEMLAELDPPVRGLVIASPANPTGTVLPPEQLAAIASWCERVGRAAGQRRDLSRPGVPGAPPTSCAWETSREAIVVNSFSKYFAMTGWRLGWLLVPPPLQRAVDRLTGNFSICPPTLAAARGRRGVHAGIARRGRSARRAVHRQPGPVATRTSDDRARPAGACRRRVLRLRRRVRLLDRLPDVLRASCSTTPAWPSRPGSTSTPCTAARTSGCRSRVRRPTSPRRFAGWEPWLAAQA